MLVLALAATAVVVLRCQARESANAGWNTATTRGRARLRELRAQPPGSIAGTVSIGTAPVARAMVCARPRDQSSAARCTTTDGRGGYLLGDLQPTRYVVWASAPALAGGHWRGSPPDFDDSVWVAPASARRASTWCWSKVRSRCAASCATCGIA